jgi:hypothetical protein
MLNRLVIKHHQAVEDRYKEENVKLGVHMDNLRRRHDLDEKQGSFARGYDQ